MHLTLHVTNRCNMRCRYCYAGPPGSADMTAAPMRRGIAVGLARPKAEPPQAVLHK
jgi:MoaA/NifB/PqqE/SkfB family radical SAM enzyme